VGNIMGIIIIGTLILFALVLAGKIQDIPVLTLRYVHPRGEMERLKISK